jgi:serine/threonine protein kinase
MNFGDLKTTNCTEKESSISQKEPLINSSISLYSREDYSNRDKFLSFINSKNPAFFENFDLLEYLNSGSSGCVYSGKFKGKNKKSVAIKFFISKKHKYIEKKKTDNNIHEINLSRKLHHKNVTEMLGYYQSPEINYSILEYGKYGDIEFFLRKLLKKHFLSETILNFFSFQILQSLQYIHKCKIVHMDIKPGNILINSNLEAKITDFSISCSYTKFQQNDIVKFPCVGTGRFMSPEILSRDSITIKDCNKVDLYSFGVTLYYLFYADFPYKLREIECKDYKELFNNIKKEELIFPEKRKISNYFKDFLTKILERDLSKRININQALNHPWIQGAKIISDEKENTSCQESFMIRLITDNIPKFNDFVNLKI